MKGGKKGRERQPGKSGAKARPGGPGSAKEAKAARKESQPRKRGERVKSYGWRSSSDDQG